MAKIWGQPKDAKKASADVEVGGAATPEKLAAQGQRDPHGDYVGAVTRTDEGIGEGTEAPAPAPQPAPAPEQSDQRTAAKAGRK